MVLAWEYLNSRIRNKLRRMPSRKQPTGESFFLRAFTSTIEHSCPSCMTIQFRFPKRQQVTRLMTVVYCSTVRFRIIYGHILVSQICCSSSTTNYNKQERTRCHQEVYWRVQPAKARSQYRIATVTMMGWSQKAVPTSSPLVWNIQNMAADLSKLCGISGLSCAMLFTPQLAGCCLDYFDSRSGGD